MNELNVFMYGNIEVADSRDVAKMIERDHNGLLKSIRTYIGYLNEGDLAHVDFFIESTYPDKKGQLQPCYLITKKGCDMIANKTTGKKGVLFTAAYVSAFEKMRQQLAGRPRPISAVSPGGLARLISVTRTAMLDMGCTANEVGQMVQSMFKTWAVPVPDALAKQIPGQMSLFSPSRPMLDS